MPDIIARFAKSNPNVELSIVCEPSRDLVDKLSRNELDIALVTHSPKVWQSQVVRTEPLLWVTSMAHSAHAETPLPLAVGRRSCDWRQLGCAALDSVGREYSILFNSSSSTVVASAVLAGLAVSLLPESALRPGMRILTASDGFPELPSAEIGIIRRPGVPSALMDAITDHIAASLDNMTPPGPDDGPDSKLPNRTGLTRAPNGLTVPSW